jgi:hypothetical protein
LHIATLVSNKEIQTRKSSQVRRRMIARYFLFFSRQRGKPVLRCDGSLLQDGRPIARSGPALGICAATQPSASDRLLFALATYKTGTRFSGGLRPVTAGPLKGDFLKESWAGGRWCDGANSASPATLYREIMFCFVLFFPSVGRLSSFLLWE